MDVISSISSGIGCITTAKWSVNRVRDIVGWINYWHRWNDGNGGYWVVMRNIWTKADAFIFRRFQFGIHIFSTFRTSIRRYIRNITIIVQQISWLLIIYAQNAWYLYLSRFLSGFAGAASFNIIPLLTAEISDDG